MKRIHILVAVLVLSVQSFAQSEIYTSNWITGLMEYNPAVAGRSLDLSAAAIFRNQWTGIDGAPTIQLLQAHKPLLSRSIAFGGSVRSVFSDPTASVGLDGNIAYRLRFNSVQLHIGSKISGTFQKVDYGGLDVLEDDPVYETSASGKLIPNVGFGAYLFNEKYYLSVSAPRLLKSKNPAGMTHLPWYYLSGGYAETVSNAFRYRFAFFAGWDLTSPMLLDFNASALFGGKMWLGAHYGTNQYGFYANYVITHQFYVGYSIDVMNRYNYANLGPSHEVMVRFEMSKNKRRVFTYRM